MEAIYVGRQPIFDRNLDLFGYELLFRNEHRPPHGDHMTGQVLVNSIMDIGLETLVGSRPAFVNLTTGFLDGTHPLPIWPERMILEVLEDVEPTPSVLDSLRSLKRRGFAIALDDFRYRPELEPLLELADWVKLDVQELQGAELREHFALVSKWPVKLVAEKVETQEEYAVCRQLGFDYFQGYFLAKPQVMAGTAGKADISVVMHLIRRLQDPLADLKELESLIIQDVSLTYRLLRHVNSAMYGFYRELESVHDALVLLGTNTIRDWACLILLTRMEKKPRALVNTVLVRAKMCEQLAIAQRVRSPHAYFTAGLFSMLDAFMDQPLPDLLPTLPLTEEIKDAVLEFKGPVGETLQLVLWYEKADWDSLDTTELDAATYRRSYVEALRWADHNARSVLKPLNWASEANSRNSQIGNTTPTR